MQWEPGWSFLYGVMKIYRELDCDNVYTNENKLRIRFVYFGWVNHDVCDISIKSLMNRCMAQKVVLIISEVNVCTVLSIYKGE